ncbi:MAG: hypothetical protein ACYC7J_11605 [Syntrophales bacterium]
MAAAAPLLHFPPAAEPELQSDVATDPESHLFDCAALPELH